MIAEKSENKKILFVDDDRLLLTQTKIFLERSDFGFKVDTAISVERALRQMGEKEYDAIISDYKMEEEDGLDLLEKVRKDYEDLPFIIFTGQGDEIVAQEALNMGADRYIRKRSNAKSQYDKLASALMQLLKER